jgi:glycosyltransferase involved in cell wall biosynthesis
MTGTESIFISVIIPIFNVESYLPRLIASLKKQMVNGVEYIFVNDGSSDNSAAILKQHAHNKQFVVISQANSGVAAARNNGLNVARGQYICFIDPDDNISDNYMQELSKAAISTSCDVIVTDWVKVNGTDIKRNIVRPVTSPISLDQEEIFREILSSDKILCSLWAKLFSKALFENNLFPLQRTCSDFIPCFTALYKANEIVYIPSVGYLYTADRASSLQNSQNSRDVSDSVTVHQELSDLICSEFPNLSELASLDLSKAKVQACIHIYKSSRINNKQQLFEHYRKNLGKDIRKFWMDKSPLSSKILSTAVAMGYLPTAAIFTTKSVVNRLCRK